MITIYFDLETTDVDIARAEITQLAAVAVDADFREVDAFTQLIRIDEKRANPEALRINHYDPARWAAEAVPCARALSEFISWSLPYQDQTRFSKAGRPFKVGTLAGYNAARFDFPLLERHCKAAGIFLPFDFRVRDAMLVAQSVCDFAGITPENFKLVTIADVFKVPVENAHDALSDVRTTIGLMRRFRGMFSMEEAPAA